MRPQKSNTLLKVLHKKLSIDHAIEFIGVFLSIILAFALQNWSEDVKNHDKEIVYLKNLHEDLVVDYNALERRIFEYDQKLKSTKKILQILSSSDNSGIDSALSIVNEELTYNSFYTPHNHTYESLKYNGDLHLITNSDFKILLSELDISYQTTKTHGLFFLEYTNSPMWSEFLVDHLHFTGQDHLSFPQKANEAETKKFRSHFFNRINRLHSFMENYYYSMQGTLQKIERVKTQVEKEMETQDISFKKAEADLM
ncbi:MAG: DUF6090 family protein [Cytophagaceae bacterium]